MSIITLLLIHIFSFIYSSIHSLIHSFHFRYDNLIDLGSQRREKLEESCKAYQLVREAGELAQWIQSKVNIYTQPSFSPPVSLIVMLVTSIVRENSILKV